MSLSAYISAKSHSYQMSRSLEKLPSQVITLLRTIFFVLWICRWSWAPSIYWIVIRQMQWPDIRES